MTLAESGMMGAEGHLLWSMLKAALFLVLLLVGSMLMKRRTKGRAAPQGAEFRLRAQCMLGPKARIVQVETATETLLLGVTEQSVSLLSRQVISSQNLLEHSRDEQGAAQSTSPAVAKGQQGFFEEQAH